MDSTTSETEKLTPPDVTSLSILVDHMKKGNKSGHDYQLIPTPRNGTASVC